MENESISDGEALLHDSEFLESLRAQMHHFATLQLADVHLAEDAVQEAFIGALKNIRTFGGRAALKSWVFAILKNKIADILRQKQKLVYTGSLLKEGEEEEDFSELFNAKGMWLREERPAAWNAPEEAMREQEFWKVFEACLEHLPNQQARIFMMREFVELDSPEICLTMNISVSNLNVMLYRARIRMRECLENNWFNESEQLC